MTTNPFAILNEYPAEGPSAPERREKVVRQKNKHESGTGRRDTEKRQGRGRSNWGNAQDDIARPVDTTDHPQGDAAAEPEQPKIDYVPASNFFSDDEDVIEAPVKVQKVVVIPSEYIDVVAAPKDVVVRRQDSDDEDKTLQIDFVSTKQVRKEQAERRQQQRGRGGPRRDGDRKPQDRRPRQDGEQQERRPRQEGEQQERRPRPDGERRQRQDGEQQERRPRQEGEQRPRQDGEQRRGRGGRPENQNRPRDQRPGNVQHQRNPAANRKQGPLNLAAFPSLK